MNIVKNLVLVSAGLLAGVAFVLSCSDDSPGDADAAACDCPAAEAPITAARMVFKTNDQVLAPGTNLGQGVSCDPGGILLGGGCGTSTVSFAPDLVVTKSTYEDTTDWLCEWKNNSTTQTYTGVVTVKCLMPAQ